MDIRSSDEMSSPKNPRLHFLAIELTSDITRLVGFYQDKFEQSCINCRKSILYPL